MLHFKERVIKESFIHFHAFRTISVIFVLQKLSDDTGSLKEDIAQLHSNLNVAAKIEVQTYEKINENRIARLEKMVEEMKLKENSLLHIIEETNNLKDQIDSLREMSYHAIPAAGPCDASFDFNEETIEQELQSQPQIILPVLSDQEGRSRTPMFVNKEESNPDNDSLAQTKQVAPTKIIGNICLGSPQDTKSSKSFNERSLVANNCLLNVLNLWLCFFD